MPEKESLVLRFGTEFISKGGDARTVFIGKSVMVNPFSATAVAESAGVEFIGYGYTPSRGNIIETTGRIWSAEDYMRSMMEKDKLFIEKHGIERALSVSERLRTPEAYRQYLLGVLTSVLQNIQKGEFVFSRTQAKYVSPFPLPNLAME